MVDTQRTLVALQSLLADNVAKDISANDIRDFLVSVHAEAGGHKNGYANYNDTATAITPLSALAGIAKLLTCNSLGAQTRETRVLPLHTTPNAYWNPTTNRVDLSQMELDTIFQVRNDFTVTPDSPNTEIRLHYRFYDSVGTFVFDINKRLADLKASGVAAQQISDSTFYIGTAILGGTMEVLLECSNDSSIVVDGLTVFVWAGATP